jgi:hypothetical protein
VVCALLAAPATEVAVRLNVEIVWFALNFLVEVPGSYRSAVACSFKVTLCALVCDTGPLNLTLTSTKDLAGVLKNINMR